MKRVTVTPAYIIKQIYILYMKQYKFVMYLKVEGKRICGWVLQNCFYLHCEEKRAFAISVSNGEGHIFIEFLLEFGSAPRVHMSQNYVKVITKLCHYTSICRLSKIKYCMPAKCYTF